MKIGKLVLIGCGPGPADLLTFRAAARIQASDLILYDRLVNKEVFEFANDNAELIYVGKKSGDGGRQQADINTKIINALQLGKVVSRLKSGDPMIFGRATEEIAAATYCGADVEIVSGVTASLAAAADSGIALTQRDEIQSFIMTTARKAKDLNVPDWSQMARPGTCISFYMGVAQAWQIQSALMAAGVPGSAPADWVERAGQTNMRTVSSQVHRLCLDAKAQGISNPAVLIVRYPFSLAKSKPVENAALSGSQIKMR